MEESQEKEPAGAPAVKPSCGQHWKAQYRKYHAADASCRQTSCEPPAPQLVALVLYPTYSPW